MFLISEHKLSLVLIFTVFAGVLCDIDSVIQENRELKSELGSCRIALDLHEWSIDKIKGNDAIQENRVEVQA